MPKVDALLETRIEAVYGKFWSSSSCDNADFVYLLSNGKYFRFPDIYQSVTHFDYCELTGDHTRCEPSGTRYGDCKRNLYQAEITDVLVPEDPELRSNDEFILALSSGLYLFQESGNATGCGTRYGLTDHPSESPMVSVFSTPAWAALND